MNIHLKAALITGVIVVLAGCNLDNPKFTVTCGNQVYRHATQPDTGFGTALSFYDETGKRIVKYNVTCEAVEE